MTLSPLDHPGEWTFDDLAGLPDDGRRWEVVDGTPVQMSPVTSRHQRVASRLLLQLAPLLPAAWECIQEIGLLLEDDGRIPDLTVARADVHLGRGQLGLQPADVALLVEVVSPGSRKTDRSFKPVEYAQAGVPHYWRVELEPEVFVVTHDLHDGAYAEAPVLRGTASGTRPFLLTIDVAALG